MIKEIENVLSDREYEDLYNMFWDSRNGFPWFLQTSSIVEKDAIDKAHRMFDKEQLVDNTLFVHQFYNSSSTNPVLSNNWIYVYSLISKIEMHLGKEIKRVMRSKANLTVDNNKSSMTWSYPHQDALHDNYYSAIYYFNEVGGDTIIFDTDGNINERIIPKKNKLLLFSSNLLHSAANGQTDNRIIINTVLET